MSSISKRQSRLIQKASDEKKRRDGINGKVDKLRDLVYPNKGEKHISQAKVLQRAVEILRGDTVSSSTSSPSSSSTSSSSSSSPHSIGPIKSHNEIQKVRQQCRRDLQATGYEALREYINANQLTDQPERLDRVSILDITITQLRNITTAAVSPSPSTLLSAVPPLLPIPLLPAPLPPAPLPLVPLLPAPLLPAPLLPVPLLPIPLFPLPIFPNPQLLLLCNWMSMQANASAPPPPVVVSSEQQEDNEPINVCN